MADPMELHLKCCSQFKCEPLLTTLSKRFFNQFYIQLLFNLGHTALSGLWQHHYQHLKSRYSAHLLPLYQLGQIPYQRRKLARFDRSHFWQAHTGYLISPYFLQVLMDWLFNNFLQNPFGDQSQVDWSLMSLVLLFPIFFKLGTVFILFQFLSSSYVLHEAWKIIASRSEITLASSLRTLGQISLGSAILNTSI